MLSADKIEEMANEVRDFLIKNELWQDVFIYFNGKAYGTMDGSHFSYNNPDDLIVLENEDPRDYFEYVNPEHILSMSFEGPLYDCLNMNGEYGYEFENSIESSLRKIFEKYGCYYELGNSWNLTLALI